MLWPKNCKNINQPPPATTYPTSTNHYKNIPTVIPFHRPPSSTQTPKTHKNFHQPFKKQPLKPPPATPIQKNNQLPKNQPPTTQKTTINNPNIHIREAKTPTNSNQKPEKKIIKNLIWKSNNPANLMATKSEQPLARSKQPLKTQAPAQQSNPNGLCEKDERR